MLILVSLVRANAARPEHTNQQHIRGLRGFRTCGLCYHPLVNVRYFLADMHLGGSREFYYRTAEMAHEMACQEAVARFDAGVKITNLDEFERKKVDGRVLITRKASNERISGWLVRLSTDLQP